MRLSPLQCLRPRNSRTGTLPKPCIGGQGGWDYVTVCPRTNWLFVTRGRHTQIIDTTKGKVIADIPGKLRSHGTAIVPAVNRGFITEGGEPGAIDVLDLVNYKLLGRIHTMPESDGIICHLT